MGCPMFSYCSDAPYLSNQPVMRLRACVKKDLPANTPVISKDELEPVLWVEVPRQVINEFQLFEVQELSEPPEDFDIEENCKHTCHDPWYQFTTSALCICPGLHIYRMHMKSRYTSDTISLFFGYVLQDDDPKKPYIYMDKSAGCGCCDKHNTTNA